MEILLRRKENTMPLERVAEKINDLLLRYNLIGGEKEKIGFIAQDVKEIFPEIIGSKA